MRPRPPPPAGSLAPRPTVVSTLHPDRPASAPSAQNLDGAKALYERLIREYPSSGSAPSAAVSWGRIHLRLGARAKALKIFDRTLRSGRLPPHQHRDLAYRLAQLHRATGDAGPALRLFASLIRADCPSRRVRVSTHGGEVCTGVTRAFVETFAAAPDHSPAEVPVVLRRLVPDHVHALGRRIAASYAGAGRLDASDVVWRALDRQSASPIQKASYQLGLVRNAQRRGAEDGLAEIRQLLPHLDALRPPVRGAERWYVAPPLRELALAESSKRGDRARRHLTRALLSHYLRLFHAYFDRPNEVALTLAELLTELGDWEAAVAHYDRILTSERWTRFHRDAARGAAHALRRLLDHRPGADPLLRERLHKAEARARGWRRGSR